MISTDLNLELIMVCKMCCFDHLNIAALALEAPWLGFHGRHKQALRIMQDPTGGNHLFKR